MFAVVEKETNRLVGHVLFGQDPEAHKGVFQLGFNFDPSMWGQGIAYEAVMALNNEAKKLGVQKITAQTIDPTHAGGLLQRCGFQCETILRQHTFHENKWVDLFIYGKHLDL